MRAIITGASSGIGMALARELSRQGWSLALLARRGELLDALAKQLPNTVALTCDVTDAQAVHEAVRKGAAALGGPFDLAVANAGIGSSGHATKFDLAMAESTVRVNLLGMLYLFDAVVPSMVERKSGRFAGVASIAGLRGLPTSASYSATKAAVQAFLEASRVELLPYGVGVTIINPGFVATPMVANKKFKMPFLVPVDKAARIIAHGLARGARVIEFPLPMSLLMRIGRLIPNAIWDRALTGFARRRKTKPS